MKKIRSNKLFHDTIDQVKKYLVVLDGDLIGWNDAEDEYHGYDDGEDWKEHHHYEMVMACLQDKRFKQDLLDSYGIKYIGVLDGYDEEGEPYTDAVIQIKHKFFSVPFYNRHYFGELAEVKQVKKIIYEKVA